MVACQSTCKFCATYPNDLLLKLAQLELNEHTSSTALQPCRKMAMIINVLVDGIPIQNKCNNY